MMKHIAILINIAKLIHNNKHFEAKLIKNNKHFFIPNI